MFSFKSSLALIAIAAGGFINAGSGPPSTVTPAAPTRLIVEDGAVPAHAILKSAAEQALLAQVRKDLQDREADIRLADLRFERTSNRSVEGVGKGTLSFDSSDAIPVEVTVSYDLHERRVEQANYLIAAGARPSPQRFLGKRMRREIADRIGSRLVLEFAQQAVDFSLLDVKHFSSGRDRIMISGTGVTRFLGEGAAHTRFVATADKSSGHILSISYELLEEIAEEDLPLALNATPDHDAKTHAFR